MRKMNFYAMPSTITFSRRNNNLTNNPLIFTRREHLQKKLAWCTSSTGT